MTTNAAIRIANDSPFCESRRSMKKPRGRPDQRRGDARTVARIERMMRTAGRELRREMMQAHFDRRSAQEQEVDVRDAEGVERLRVRERRRTGDDGVRRGVSRPQAVPSRRRGGAGTAGRRDGAARREVLARSASYRRRGGRSGVVRRGRRVGPEAERGEGPEARTRGAGGPRLKITIVLDIVHVLEYLWRAAYAFHADGTTQAHEWVELASLNGPAVAR